MGFPTYLFYGFLLLFAYCILKPFLVMCAGLGLFIYLVHFAMSRWMRPKQNLKRKYVAEWALVTGASSGIGKELVTRLAEQGLNVVCVAMDDEDMQELREHTHNQFPELQFVFVAADLSTPGYMQEIEGATMKLPIKLVFCNAGYMLMKSLHSIDPAAISQYIECNIASHVKIAHHFYKLMVERSERGAICFTSSECALCPAPYSHLYCAAKAFMLHFARSLWIDARRHDIDVLTVLPGPVKTKLFSRMPRLKIMEMMGTFEQRPSDVVDVVFRNIEAPLPSADSGYFTLLMHLAERVAGPDLVAWVMVRVTKWRMFEDMEQLEN